MCSPLTKSELLLILPSSSYLHFLSDKGVLCIFSVSTSGKLFILEMKVKKWNQIGSRLEQV